MSQKSQKKWKSRLVVLFLLASLISPVSLSQANTAQTLTICVSLKSGVQIISKSGNCNERLYEKVTWFQNGNSPQGTPGSKLISMTTCRSKSVGNTQVIKKSCNRATQTSMKWQRPLGPPEAPSIVSITPGNLGTAEIMVKAPENNGGARITSYSVVQFNNDVTSSKSSVGSKFLGTSAVSYPLKSREKISVGGLTPGESYRFAVVATNVAGTSQLSASSKELLVPKTPNAPTISSVTATGLGSVLIAFAISESEFTAPITSFTITANPGGLQSTVTSPLLRSHTFTGLSHSTQYTFTIVANSAAGSSSPSEQSPPVRTFAPQPPPEPIQTSSGPSAPAPIAAPVIALSSTSETSTAGVALTGYTIESTGGAVASYSISPSAPAGLTFNAITGLLSGSPTVVASSTIYTVTGTNASGSSTATFDLTVVLGAPAFTTTVTSESAATSSPIAGYLITSTGGAIASYSISPSAPAGLTFNTSTGLLSGTPTNVASSTTYTITGINAAGSATATFDLTVTLGAPTFTLSSSSENRTVNTAATGFTATSTGGAVDSYSISPSAPAGMSFDTSTGAFTGTPTIIAGATVYTITATNATGSFTRTFTFTVPVAAPAFTLSSSAESRTANTVATGFTVSSTGGAVASYSISPSAPAGMSFNTSTGAFAGTPTTIAGATVYTVTATNATGSSTATFTFTVVVAAPTFTLSSSSENRTVNTAATGFTATSTGGAVDSYSISPSAPAGMSFDTSTGAFTGTPTIIAGATVYTITATNATGSSTATFTLTVVVAAPAFTLSSSAESRATGNSLTGYTITSTGGAVASYSISPSAPAGLTFSTSTGLLSGSPTSVASATTYTITATNTSGTTTATFELTVTLGTPSFSLSSTSEVRSAGTTLSGYTISSTGGTIASYSISPSAPTGLTFSSSTGLLSGTPTFAASATTYTITATNDTGNSTAEFVLTVNVGAATKAMITTNPAGAAAGAAFTTQPVVRITDSSGNTVTTSTVNVVASIGSGSGTLSGTTTVAAINGVAAFSDLVLTGTAGNFTLTFTPTSLTAATSNNFALSAGVATQAMTTTQPDGAVNGSAFSTQPVIRITDASGNTVTTSTVNVVASIGSGSGTLSGTTTVGAVNGVATFTNLSISGSGNHTLTFTPTSLTAVTSNTFSVTTPLVPTKVAVTRASVGTTYGAVFTTQPQVTIQNENSATVSSSSATVTATISAGGALIGTTSVNAVNGVATFTNLGLKGKDGTAYTITYTVTGLTTATQSVTPSGGYSLGATGPGGGKVFYVATSGFSCGPTLTETCFYLEVAPVAAQKTADWAASFYKTSLAGASGTAIGSGYKNTLAIITQGNTNASTVAAAYAQAYRGGSLTDWYLGSTLELTQIYVNRSVTHVGSDSQHGFTGEFWTSTEDNASQAYTYNVFTGAGPWTNSKNDNPVRPIRSF